jgi:DNA invertase Pin-like site-specific DNA recombinase
MDCIGLTMPFITNLAGLSELLNVVPTPSNWAYVRVSDDSHEDNESPDVQREAILAYCALKKLPTPHFVYEKASAAKPLFSVRLPGQKTDTGEASSPRPLLSTLIAHLCERRGTNLIIWKLDRLSRVAAEQDMLFSFFERHQINLAVAYASESYLTESGASQDPVRVLMRQVLGSFAQYERHLIQMRMRMGSQAKYLRGGWIGGGTPYGYRIVDKDLVIDGALVDTVRMIFGLRDVPRMTLNGIVRYLKAHGYKNWYRMKVKRVLDNRRLYRGVLVDPTGAEHARPDLQILLTPTITVIPDDTPPPSSAPASGDTSLPEPELDEVS